MVQPLKDIFSVCGFFLLSHIIVRTIRTCLFIFCYNLQFLLSQQTLFMKIWFNLRNTVYISRITFEQQQRVLDQPKILKGIKCEILHNFKLLNKNFEFFSINCNPKCIYHNKMTPLMYYLYVYVIINMIKKYIFHCCQKIDFRKKTSFTTFYLL